MSSECGKGLLNIMFCSVQAIFMSKLCNKDKVNYLQNPEGGCLGTGNEQKTVK